MHQERSAYGEPEILHFQSLCVCKLLSGICRTQTGSMSSWFQCGAPAARVEALVVVLSFSTVEKKICSRTGWQCSRPSVIKREEIDGQDSWSVSFVVDFRPEKCVWRDVYWEMKSVRLNHSPPWYGYAALAVSSAAFVLFVLFLHWKGEPGWFIPGCYSTCSGKVGEFVSLSLVLSMGDRWCLCFVTELIGCLCVFVYMCVRPFTFTPFSSCPWVESFNPLWKCAEISL